MKTSDFERLVPRAWIIGRADGTFESLRQFEPGAVEAEIMLVRGPEPDDEEQLVLGYDEGDSELSVFVQPPDRDWPVIDAIAWEAQRPGIWWTLGGTAYIGEWELRRAWWDEEPARMVSTPAAFLAAHGDAFLLLRWDVDVDAILGDAPGVICDTPALAAKLRRTLIEQAAPRRRMLEVAIRAYPITIQRPVRRRAAA